jgi:D-alanyl-D-alanine dipeptidase
MLYKIALNRYIFLPGVLIFFHLSGVFGQGLDTSAYGVPVLRQIADYQKSMQADSCRRMVELRSLAPGIKYDLRYATVNNFMHRQMYRPAPRFTFLRLPAARALAGVQKELNAKGYGLKVFDAYRPYSVTVAFWELVKDERYVANPSKGSGHNRGLAVDLTIVRLVNGQELDMGTGFDNFTDTAHHAFEGLTPAVLENRKLLRETMERFGFTAIKTEWWHYYWDNDRGYEVLDVPFRKLR